ncbi:hypothetical protein FAM09_30140 [Niastella caeni]|uniref:Lipoprotein n=1 Tax=Niastella caeni TaxID=2569763 RepID=A0A4S8H8U6_9BACT|nr:hypothetical protein [Niastella caeni]THU30419.1 hypothetical protein FAM09_30140 [Niastella caeni]
MRKACFMVATTAAITILSCGGEVKVKDVKITPVDGKEVAEAMSKEVEKSTDRWQERRAKGDTLAMPYKELQAYLPEIAGYTKKGGPKGNQVNMPGMGSWSQAEQRYENGDKRIEVKIVDYNASYAAFSGITALYKMGFSSEDDSKKQGSVDLGMKNVAAYETVYKQDPKAQIVLIVADRYFVEIESRGSNEMGPITDIAKGIAASGLASK